ncbi:Type I restriction-modification system, specificity subunit S [Acinetobacter guillouiae MSP4-18]|uniref:restriction endonuclease subunit S n=1 Tax=Acinetobacter guillouiae TaxID=106649 RepID=UPI0002D0ECF2|nr:restriction endonuclease subunit S [Acinetobacter guillouiae]ENU60694.1 hypothetical protein F981_00607 [Acinetobacter guillouiae CIP 63.46]EPH32110.1 Type I restriction-modification system, specificity subunit S [Acinetobacter guillouiae MSP4-18]KAB0629877.1 restriction endonuclease subunit S [Acinetobacter guillouiae]
MTTPKLRFKEFDGDWSASNLEKTTEYFKGFAFKSESYKEDGVRIIRVSDLDKDSIKYQNEAIFLDKTEAQNYLNWEVKKKDIIVTTVGSKPHLIDSAVGRPIFVKNDNEGLLNQNLLVLRPKNENIYAYFIFSQLLDKKYLTHIETIQRGNANQSNITVKDLQEFQVFQTSKEEQTKIASFLSAVDEKISQLSQKHELLSQYKQGMMQKLFSQQIRFKADDGSEFGEWEEKKIRELFIEVKDKVLDQDIETYSITAGKGFVSQAEKFGRDISGQQNSNYIVLEKNDFSYNKGNSKTYKYGCVYLNEFEHAIAVPNVFISFRAKTINRINQKFYAKLFEFHYLDRHLRLLISSSARMDGLLNVSKESFFDINVPCPCVEEQAKIANFLSAIDQKLEKVAQQIEETKQWKKGLLQQMFV